jgi:hypothetical protein
MVQLAHPGNAGGRRLQAELPDDTECQGSDYYQETLFERRAIKRQKSGIIWLTFL